MNKTAPTKRQQQILDFIMEQTRRKGYPPSVREIGAAVGLSSSSTVHSHLMALEKQGFIRRDPTKPRALELLNWRDSGLHLAGKSKSIPLVGRVAAGQPLLAEENIDDFLAVPAEMADDNSYLLRVKGESMIDAGIYNGDILIIRRQPTANNGDIVVALIGEEATVKRFYRENKFIRLQPENKKMEPIITDRAVILGKVIGLMRRF